MYRHKTHRHFFRSRKRRMEQSQRYIVGSVGLFSFIFIYPKSVKPKLYLWHILAEFCVAGRSLAWRRSILADKSHIVHFNLTWPCLVVVNSIKPVQWSILYLGLNFNVAPVQTFPVLAAMRRVVSAYVYLICLQSCASLKLKLIHVVLVLQNKRPELYLTITPIFWHSRRFTQTVGWIEFEPEHNHM